MSSTKNCLAPVFMAASLACLAAPANAAEFNIDPAHTFVQFRISHLGYSTVVGRFDKVSGTFSWDPQKPETAAIDVHIATDSIDTNFAERDKHLRSAKFLDVAKYPEATFKSTKYVGNAKGGTLEGELTLHGVTKPLTVDIKPLGEGPDPWGGYRAGFTGSATMRRADWGVGYNLGPAADTMEFDLFVEGIRQ